MPEVARQLKGMATKARTQIVKDYIAFPLLSSLLMAYADRNLHKQPEPDAGRVQRAIQTVRRRRPRVRSEHPALTLAKRLTGPTFRSTLTADVTANVIRNVWAYAIIFCGHFPDQTYTFSIEETEDETTGGRYVRQLLGAANIEGSALFHVMSGNLGYQAEHHFYPDMPSTRYDEIAPRVRGICERYELPYAEFVGIVPQTPHTPRKLALNRCRGSQTHSHPAAVDVRWSSRDCARINESRH